MRKIILYAAVALGLGAAPVQAQEPNEILNVSYDIARELYEQINQAFVADWKARTGQELTVNQSHAGSSKQAAPFWRGWKPMS